jgi:signal transduction histidine kinase
MDTEVSGVPLRHRVLLSILAVTTLAVVTFALPLGVVVQRLYRSEAVTSLQRDAARVAVTVPDTIQPSLISLPRQPVLGVYDVSGRRVYGSGPALSNLAAGTVKAKDAIEGVDLAVIVPIPSDQKAVGTVRAALPYRVITDRVHRAWAAMAALALIAIGLAAVLARRQALRLAAPLERLTGTARALGDGDFTVRVQHSGIREADTASAALAETAAQLGQFVDRERAFASDVSHQLRTPLTTLIVGLEAALERPDGELRPALRDALARTEHLNATIDDLISMVHRPRLTPVPVGLAGLLTDARARWSDPLGARGRTIVVSCDPGLPRVLAPPAAIRQILDVLISNALWHGEGTVTVSASAGSDGVGIGVADEGCGLPCDPAELLSGSLSLDHLDGHGRGLPLAFALARAAGGNLSPGPSAQPVFMLVLPVSRTGSLGRGR